MLKNQKRSFRELLNVTPGENFQNGNLASKSRFCINFREKERLRIAGGERRNAQDSNPQKGDR